MAIVFWLKNGVLKDLFRPFCCVFYNKKGVFECYVVKNTTEKHKKIVQIVIEGVIVKNTTYNGREGLEKLKLLW